MGQSKAMLPFGHETMLERVVGVLQQVVSPVVIVAAKRQSLPPLPAGIEIAYDEQPDMGPLGGMLVGLTRLEGRVEVVYVSSCDAPLLKTAFVRWMIEALGVHDIAIPRDGKYFHPLAAVYRTELAGTVRQLIQAGRLRPFDLLGESKALEIDVERLRSVDADLSSLRNTNTPEEYAAALRDAGLDAAPPMPP